VASLIFFLRIERVDRLDQTDRSDGDEILDIDAGVFEFAGDVDDEPQVALDQHGTDRRVAGRQLFQQIFFFLPRKRRRQRFAAADIVNLFAFQSEQKQKPVIEQMQRQSPLEKHRQPPEKLFLKAMGKRRLGSSLP